MAANSSELLSPLPEFPDRPKRWYIVESDTLISPGEKPVILRTDELDTVNRLLQGETIDVSSNFTEIARANRLVLAGLAKVALGKEIRLNPEISLYDYRNLPDHGVEHEPRTAEREKQEIAHLLEMRGYALSSPEALGIERFEEHLLEHYFNNDTLRVVEGDVPADRERARCVIRYGHTAADAIIVGKNGHVIHSPQSLYLEPHADTSVGVRLHSNIATDKRPDEYPTFTVLRDQKWILFITALLSAIPQTERFSTLAVNLFRTHTDVVSQPHQDEEKWVIVYCVDKVGTGARTQLFEQTGASEFAEYPCFSETIQPGQLLIFSDEKFLHMTSNLIPPAEGDASRSVVVITINKDQTHKWTDDPRWNIYGGI